MLSDLPLEIIHMALDLNLKFRPTNLRYPHQLHNYSFDIVFQCNIDYANRSFGMDLRVYATDDESVIIQFEKEMNDFVEKINNQIPATLSLDYCKTRVLSLYMPVEIDDDFISIDNHHSELNEYHIEYTGTHFKIGDLMLPKNAYNCVLDLIQYIKLIVHKT